MFFDRVKRLGWRSWVTVGVLALFFLLYQWNARQYQAEWGYDAREHLAYIFLLAEEGRLPTPAENYLAWHEPGYYWLQAGLVRGLERVGASRLFMYKMVQAENAVWAWLLAVGAGVLAWLVPTKSGRSWARAMGVGVSTGVLFAVAALGRSVTNETMAQALIVWWLVWFCAWRMDDPARWNWWRWLALAIGMAAIMWIKLTAVVLLAAVVVWLLWWGVFAKKWSAVGWAALLAVVVLGLYTPWFLHRQNMYGTGATINNYEQQRGAVTSTMPLAFYFNWDASIWPMPFWSAGRESFWTMFLASAVVDYDNVFEKYPVPVVAPSVQTGNGRWIPLTTVVRSRWVLAASIPLAVWLVIGLGAALRKIIQARRPSVLALLAILAFGLLAALLYNTYRYPFLERGTLKAIFIVVAFPLLFIVALEGWRLPTRWRKIALVYWLGWCGLTVSVVGLWP